MLMRFANETMLLRTQVSLLLWFVCDRSGICGDGERFSNRLHLVGTASSTHLCTDLVNLLKLPRPSSRVEEWPEIKPIVVGTVALGMIAWSERRHLVSVPGVFEKEELDLSRNLLRCHCLGPSRCIDQLEEHRVRSALGNLAKSTKDGQLVVGHAHVGFIGLDVIRGNGLEFGSRRSSEKRV